MDSKKLNKRYALVDAEGNVVNVIVWDGNSPFKVPEGHQLIQSVYANRGDFYDRYRNKFEKITLIG